MTACAIRLTCLCSRLTASGDTITCFAGRTPRMAERLAPGLPAIGPALAVLLFRHPSWRASRHLLTNALIPDRVIQILRTTRLQPANTAPAAIVSASRIE